MSKNNVAKKKTNAKKRPKKINANVDIKKAATIQRTKISSSSQTGPFPEIINNLKNSTPAIPLTSIALSADSNVELLSLKDHWRSIKSNCKNYPNIYSYAKKLKAEAKLSKKALKASVRETRKQKMAFTDYQVKINKLITCSICFDIYSQPHVLECGHVHCYFCLQNWIATCEHNGSCPTCRKSLSVVPIPSISVQQLVDLSIEGLDAEAKATAVKRLMDDKLKLPPNNSLWKDWVKTGNRYIDDNDDDVGRCAECGWEIVDGECAHCGMVYLNFVEHGGLDVDSDSESIPTFFGREVDDEVFSSDSDMDDFIARDDAILYESDDHEDPLQSDNDSVDDHGAPGSRNVVLSSDGEPDQENNLHCSSGSDVDSEIEAVMPRRTGSAANLINDSDSDNENGNILSSGGSSRGSNRVIFSDDDE